MLGYIVYYGGHIFLYTYDESDLIMRQYLKTKLCDNELNFIINAFNIKIDIKPKYYKLI